MVRLCRARFRARSCMLARGHLCRNDPSRGRAPGSISDAGALMRLSPFIVAVPLTLAECTASTAVPSRSVEPEASIQPRITCDDQVQQMEPPPTGEFRDDYMWHCLLEHQFDAYVWERQGCSRGADCTVVKTSCPFGCGVAVAKAYAANVLGEHARLKSEFAKRGACKYTCDQVVSAACIQQRCTARHLFGD